MAKFRNIKYNNKTNLYSRSN